MKVIPTLKKKAAKRFERILKKNRRKKNTVDFSSEISTMLKILNKAKIKE